MQASYESQENGVPLFSNNFKGLIIAYKTIKKKPKLSLKVDDAVLKLVAIHQNFDKVLAEASTVPEFIDCKNIEEFFHNDQISNFNVSGLISWLKDSAHLINSPLAMFAPNILAKKILEYTSITRNDLAKSITENNYKKILTILNVIEHLLECGNFDLVIFNGVLLQKSESFLPLEVIWLLHKHNILSIEKYCHSVSNSVLLPRMAQSLFKLLYQKNVTIGQDVFEGVISNLVHIGFSEALNIDASLSNKETAKVSILILEMIIKTLLNCIMKKNIKVEPWGNIFGIIINSSTLTPNILKIFCNHMLTMMLTHNSVIKVTQAISQQTEWSSCKAHAALLSLFQQILKIINMNEVISILEEILNHHEVNWQYLLTFVAIFLRHINLASSLFKEFIHQLLQRGLDHSEQESLIAAFLLARQACQEGIPFFLSYNDWFKKCFSDMSTTLAMNRKSFLFLMKFLSDIVPHEPAKFLRVHVVSPPYAPAKCKTVLNDYISLAKTRLTDLKESLKQSSTEDLEKEKFTQKAKEDVDRALLSFQKRNKIPPGVLEASIFQKPYYLQYFLPVLLTPGSKHEVGDVREQFITVLNKAGKIPSSVFTSYKDLCRKETENNDLLDEPVQEELNAFEQLSKNLEEMSNCIIESHSKTLDFDYRKSISALSYQLNNILSETEKCPVIEPILININHPNSSPSIAKITDLLLNYYCKTVLLLLNNGSAWPNCEGWTTNFISMLLASHTKLHQTLFLRIWELIICKNHQLEVIHIPGLSSLLVQMTSLNLLFPQAILETQLNIPDTFINLIFNTLQHSTKNQMIFSFRLISNFLYFSLKMIPSQSLGKSLAITIPDSVILKWQYLVNRLSYKTQIDDSDECALDDRDVKIKIDQSEDISQLIKEKPLTFGAWVDFELLVNPSEDYLDFTQRKQYYWYNFHRHYALAENSDGGFKGSYLHASSVLFQSLYNFDIKNSLKINLGTRTEIINLLQESSSLLPPLCSKPLDDSSANEPDLIIWLQNVFQQNFANKNHDTEDPSSLIQLHSELLAFFRLTLVLPAHLWFTNHISIAVSKRTMVLLIQIINTFMINFLVEESSLPLWLTTHMFQGLCLVSSTKVTRESIFENFLDSSPIFIASIALHLPKLKSIVSIVPADSYVFHLIEELTNNINLIERCILNDSEMTVTSFDKPWYLGLQITNQLLFNMRQPNSFNPEQVLKRLSKFGKKVIEAIFLHCLIVGTEKSNNSQEMSRAEILAIELVVHYPHCVQVLDNRHQCIIVNQMSRIVPRLTLKTLTIIGLRIMIRSFKERPVLVQEFPYQLHAAILLYTTVSSLHDKMTVMPDSKVSDAIPLHLFKYYQSIDITFLMEANQVLHHQIEEAPEAALRLIPESEFIRFDKEMQTALRDRLKEIRLSQ